MPLALLELLRGLGSAELAAGSGCPRLSSPGGSEEQFPAATGGSAGGDAAAAGAGGGDPSGDLLLMWRAAARMGIAAQAGAAGRRGGGLVEFGARVRFPASAGAGRRPPTGPLWSLRERQEGARGAGRGYRPRRLIRIGASGNQGAGRARGRMRRSRRSWSGSAGRGGGPGGLAAAAAFLELGRATDPRPPAAGRSTGCAGRGPEPNARPGSRMRPLGLLVAAEAGTAGPAPGRVEMESLRGQIASDQYRGSDAAPATAAPRPGCLSRSTPTWLARMHLDALEPRWWPHAIWSSRAAMREAAQAARGQRHPVPTRRARSTSCSTRSRCG